MASTTLSAPCAAPHAPPLLMHSDSGRLKALVFDGSGATPELKTAIDEADLALVSVPPGENGDAVLTAFGDALRQARRLAVDRLSVRPIGVYGSRDGAWVDEETPARPGSARSRERAAAEQAWQRLGARCRRRSRDPAARRHLRTRPECARADRQRQSPAHCESQARSSIASMWPISPRPSTRPSRARPPAFSTPPMTSRARPASRWYSRRNCWAATRRRKSASPTRAVDVADGL